MSTAVWAPPSYATPVPVRSRPAPFQSTGAVGRPGLCTCRPAVLYVDDRPVNTEVMQAVFAYLPAFRLVVASDGASALLQAEAEQPVLLLLDLRLPDCDGVELLARLRALPALAAVPAVAVTASAPPDLLATSDFVDVWAKPLRIARVLQGVERLAGAAAHATASV